MKKINMSDSAVTLLKFALCFVLLSVLVGWLYSIGVNRPPLKYAKIPISTQDFLRDANRRIPDLGLGYTSNGPFDWDNDKDWGQNDENWSHEEDANFIVYYHRDKQAVWQGNAQAVLSEANATIPKLEDLMGKYYYPSYMNGRKLAIYLPESEDEYAKTVASLRGTEEGMPSGSIGLTVTVVGPFGCMTKGIILHPICFDEYESEVNGYRKVLQHEMNHYVFLSSLNYGKDIKHYNWICEGLAEYFCMRHDHHQVSGADSINYIRNNCYLNNEFPMEKNSEYWAGESFYLYLEHSRGRKGVQNFIDNSYEYSTDSTFIVSKINRKDFQNKWMESLSVAVEQPAEGM